MNVTETIKQKMEEAKAEYFRVADLWKHEKASIQRMTYHVGLYEGLERAWRECVLAEIDAKSKEVTE